MWTPGCCYQVNVDIIESVLSPHGHLGFIIKSTGTPEIYFQVYVDTWELLQPLHEHMDLLPSLHGSLGVVVKCMWTPGSHYTVVSAWKPRILYSLIMDN